jgi:hypothetical protein
MKPLNVGLVIITAAGLLALATNKRAVATPQNETLQQRLERLQGHHQQDGLAERLRSIQVQQREYKEKDSSAPGKHEVVLLTAYSSYFFNENTNGAIRTYVYGENGFIVYNADSSSGAPQYQGPITLSTYNTNTQQSTYTVTNNPPSFSQTVADLLNDGYKIVNSSFDGQYAPTPAVLLVK